MELTCKKLGQNLKNWVGFRDLNNLQNWDFTLTWHTKNPVTRSIFEVEGSSFGFSLIFVCSKIHILQLNVSDWFFNYLIFYTPLPKGVRIKILNSNLVQNFCIKYLGKVKKVWFNINMRLKEINKNAPGPPPGLIGLTISSRKFIQFDFV